MAKTKAQLDREIAETLARRNPRVYGSGSARTMYDAAIR